jgi:hypothetical protein
MITVVKLGGCALYQPHGAIKQQQKQQCEHNCQALLVNNNYYDKLKARKTILVQAASAKMLWFAIRGNCNLSGSSVCKRSRREPKDQC